MTSNASRRGITSANVKIIIADVDSTLNVGTLLVDGQHLTTIYFSALLVLVTLVHTLSDVLDDFLLRLRGFSLWPCPGCADSRCASRAPPDQLLLNHLVPLRFSRSSVLSVASCNVTSFTASCVSIFLRSPGLFDQPTERDYSRDRSLWLFGAHVSSTMACLMLSRHPSLCSLTSALICAVLHSSSLESQPACTREYASRAS